MGSSSSLGQTVTIRRTMGETMNLNIPKNLYIPEEPEIAKGIREFVDHEKRDAMYKVATFLVDHHWGKPRQMTNGLGVLLLTWNQAFYRYGAFDLDKLEKFISKNLGVLRTYRGRDVFSFNKSDENMITKLFGELYVALQIDVIRFSEEGKTNDRRKTTRKQLEDFLGKVKIKYNGTGELIDLFNSLKRSRKLKGSIEFINKKASDPKKHRIQLRISALAVNEQNILESMKLIKRSPVAVVKGLHLLAPEFFPLWDEQIAKGYNCSYAEQPAEKFLLFFEKIKAIAEHVRNYSCVAGIPDKTITKPIDEYNYSKYTKGWI